MVTICLNLYGSESLQMPFDMLSIILKKAKKTSPVQVVAETA